MDIGCNVVVGLLLVLVVIDFMSSSVEFRLHSKNEEPFFVRAFDVSVHDSAGACEFLESRGDRVQASASKNLGKRETAVAHFLNVRCEKSKFEFMNALQSSLLA